MKTISKMIVIFLAIQFNYQLFAQTDNLAVISADKIKVLYLGIDNPISIAVPGITSDKIKVTVKNGNITGGNGKYIVKVNNTTESIIEVTAEIRPGEFKKVGSETFIIKKIPNPNLCLGNYCDDTFFMSKEEFLENPEFKAEIGLPFDVKYDIVSYTFTYQINDVATTIKVNGKKITPEIIDIIKNQKDNNKVIFEDIIARGPDGILRKLNSIIITLKPKN
jgi:gliding motility-associated protein GldM